MESRAKLHDELCEWLVTELNEKGCPSVHYGAEHNSAKEIHPLLRYLHDDKTARFIKHQPDIISIIERKTVFIEVKTLTRYDTPNFSIEADSLKVLKDMHKIGCQCIIIFNITRHIDIPYETMRCCFAQEIKTRKIYIQRTPTNSNESGTAFKLIKKDASYLKLFDEIIQEIKKSE